MQLDRLRVNRLIWVRIRGVRSSTKAESVVTSLELRAFQTIVMKCRSKNHTIEHLAVLVQDKYRPNTASMKFRL